MPSRGVVWTCLSCWMERSVSEVVGDTAVNTMMTTTTAD